MAARTQLIENLEAFQAAADADLAATLRGEMWDLVESYNELKARAPANSISWICLILARDLVRDKPEVRRYLQNRFTHIFIDEFQDTDPLQAEILLLLAVRRPRRNRTGCRSRPNPESCSWSAIPNSPSTNSGAPT